MPIPNATGRLVTVQVPGFTRDHHTHAAAPGWLTASFTLSERRQRRIERGGELRALTISDDDDFLIIGFRTACVSVATSVPDALRCRVTSTIPIAAGRGASSAAVVAGIIGARALLDLSLDEAAVAHMACVIDASPSQVHAAIEGHSVATHITCDDD